MVLDTELDSQNKKLLGIYEVDLNTIRSCSTCNNDKIMVVSDRRSKCELKVDNSMQKRICRVRVDDCVIRSQEINKCDYIVEVYDVEDDLNDTDNQKEILKKIFFVELKGSDLRHAVMQIEKTYEELKSIYKRVNPVISFRACVVTTRCPLSSSDLRKLKIEFMRKNKFEIDIKNILLEIGV